MEERGGKLRYLVRERILFSVFPSAIFCQLRRVKGAESKGFRKETYRVRYLKSNIKALA